MKNVSFPATGISFFCLAYFIPYPSLFHSIFHSCPPHFSFPWWIFHSLSCTFFIPLGRFFIPFFIPLLDISFLIIRFFHSLGGLFHSFAGFFICFFHSLGGLFHSIFDSFPHHFSFLCWVFHSLFSFPWGAFSFHFSFLP